MKILKIIAFASLFFACKSQAELKKEQYMVEGRELYLNKCANCHQVSGEGLAGLYPPLKSSDYLTMANKNAILCGIKDGMTKPIVVNGKRYSQKMPAFPEISNIDIAEITTYVYNTWGSQDTIFEVKDVNKILKNCSK